MVSAGKRWQHANALARMELYDEALMYYHLSLDSDPGSKAARANRDLALSGKSVRDLPPPRQGSSGQKAAGREGRSHPKDDRCRAVIHAATQTTPIPWFVSPVPSLAARGRGLPVVSSPPRGVPSQHTPAGIPIQGPLVIRHVVGGSSRPA